jgi:hypothetical protein
MEVQGVRPVTRTETFWLSDHSAGVDFTEKGKLVLTSNKLII